MSNQPVVQANPETGEVVNQNPNKPDYGSVRVDQTITQFTGGFLNKTNRVAFIGGRMEDLKAAGFTEGQELNGQIVVHESTEPFYDGQSPKINPETSEVIQHEGSDVYRNSFYTEDMSEEDQLLSSGSRELRPEEMKEEISEELAHA